MHTWLKKTEVGSEAKERQRHRNSGERGGLNFQVNPLAHVQSIHVYCIYEGKVSKAQKNGKPSVCNVNTFMPV
jgi:hypothetical protein